MGFDVTKMTPLQAPEPINMKELVAQHYTARQIGGVPETASKEARQRWDATLTRHDVSQTEDIQGRLYGWNRASNVTLTGDEASEAGVMSRAERIQELSKLLNRQASGEPLDEEIRALMEAVRESPTHRGGHDARISSGSGDDTVQVYDDGTVFAGGGNDHVSGYRRLKAFGGEGDDVLEGYGEARLSGGAGDDRLSAYGDSWLDGGEGDDHLSAGADSTLFGGAGNDLVRAGRGSVVDGGSGDDLLRGSQDVSLSGGEGYDVLWAGRDSTLDGGAGDDLLTAGTNSVLSGGTGDDHLRAGEGSEVHFGRGDGHDVLETGDGVSVVFEGISQADVTVAQTEDGAFRVSLTETGDSITIGGGGGGMPADSRLVFADGSVSLGALVDMARPQV